MKPNILFILTDDQPYYTLPLMPQTMSLLVNQGVRFANGYVGTPVCGPARGQIFTGKWSHITGMIETAQDGGAITQFVNSGETQQSIFMRMKEAGYTTFHTGKFTNGMKITNFQNFKVPGIDVWFPFLEPYNRDDEFYYSINNKELKKVPRSGDWTGNLTGVTSDLAERFIRNHKENPWFACVWPNDPHGPYVPLDKYKDAFRRAVSPVRGTPAYQETDLSDKSPEVQKRARDNTDLEVRQEQREEYRGKRQELAAVDMMVKRLHTALAETGQLDNTYIIYATDNGYEFGGHGMDKKNWPYEDSTRTPFVVSGPGVPEGVTSTDLVSHLDLAPTICSIGGADTSGFFGRNIMDRFDHPFDEWRKYLMVEAEQRGFHSLRNDRFLFVWWKDGWEELYDYVDDPYQLDGSISTYQEGMEFMEMRRRLNIMRDTTDPQEFRSLEV